MERVSAFEPPNFVYGLLPVKLELSVLELVDLELADLELADPGS